LNGTFDDFKVTQMSIEYSKCVDDPKCKSKEEVDEFVSRIEIVLFKYDYKFNPVKHYGQPLFKQEEMLLRYLVEPSKVKSLEYFV
jgi:hypothetical protein